MAKLTAQVTTRVEDAVYRRLHEIGDAERRKMNEVARALLERGIAAYERDGSLFEPEQRPETIKVEMRNLSKSKSKKADKTGTDGE